MVPIYGEAKTITRVFAAPKIRWSTKTVLLRLLKFVREIRVVGRTQHVSNPATGSNIIDIVLTEGLPTEQPSWLWPQDGPLPSSYFSCTPKACRHYQARERHSQINKLIRSDCHSKKTVFPGETNHFWRVQTNWISTSLALISNFENYQETYWLGFKCRCLYLLHYNFALLLPSCPVAFILSMYTPE